VCLRSCPQAPGFFTAFCELITVNIFDEFNVQISVNEGFISHEKDSPGCEKFLPEKVNRPSDAANWKRWFCL